ncbi:hypothetical protein LguiB_018545 [Lonicera macranthoides]
MQYKGVFSAIKSQVVLDGKYIVEEIEAFTKIKTGFSEQDKELSFLPLHRK